MPCGTYLGLKLNESRGCSERYRCVLSSKLPSVAKVEIKSEQKQKRMDARTKE